VKIQDEIKEHPILMLAMSVLIAVAITVGNTTFATMSYVDKKHKESKNYTKEKVDTIKNDIKEIKATLRNINNNILKLFKGK